MMHQQAASSHYPSAQAGSQHYQGQPSIAMMGQSGQGSGMMGQRPLAPYRPSQQGTTGCGGDTVHTRHHLQGGCWGLGLHGGNTFPEGGQGWSPLWVSRRGWAAVSKWTVQGVEGRVWGQCPGVPRVAQWAHPGGVREAEARSSLRPPTCRLLTAVPGPGGVLRGRAVRPQPGRLGATRPAVLR